LDAISLLRSNFEYLHRGNGSKNLLGRLRNATGNLEQKVGWSRKDVGSLPEKPKRPGAKFSWFISSLLFIHYKSGFGAISKISCKYSQCDYT
jgi:hypothetical protein